MTKRPHLYILHDKTPIPVNDDIAWARWFQDVEKRRVAKTLIEGTDVEVSTVFLGVDMGILNEPPSAVRDHGLWRGARPGLLSL